METKLLTQSELFWKAGGAPVPIHWADPQEPVDKSKLSDLQLRFLDCVETWLEKKARLVWRINPWLKRGVYGYELIAKPDRSASHHVWVVAEPEETILFFNDYPWHYHLGVSMGAFSSAAEVCEASIALLDAMVCGTFKMVVKKSSGKPYKWTAYVVFEDGEWRRLGAAVAVWHNYFGHRTVEELGNAMESEL